MDPRIRIRTKMSRIRNTGTFILLCPVPSSLTQYPKFGPPILRRGAVTLLHAFCEQTKVDYYEYVPQLIRSLILLFVDTDEGVLQEAWNALNAVTKTLDTSTRLFLIFPAFRIRI
jgi:hypothetical protein